MELTPSQKLDAPLPVLHGEILPPVGVIRSDRAFDEATEAYVIAKETKARRWRELAWGTVIYGPGIAALLYIAATTFPIL